MSDPMNEDKTPDPKKPGGDQNPQNMGGPSFNPGLIPDEDKDVSGEEAAVQASLKDDTQILDNDQIPSVTPPAK